MKATPGPGGRLLQGTHQFSRSIWPIQVNQNGAVFNLPTGGNADVVTTVIMPSDGWVAQSTMTCSNAGTGTGIATCIWFTAASAGGSALCGAHVNPAVVAGAGVDLDTSGQSYSAPGTQAPVGGQPEGKQIFLNCTWDAGSHTAGGSFECALFLLL